MHNVNQHRNLPCQIPAIKIEDSDTSTVMSSEKKKKKKKKGTYWALNPPTYSLLPISLLTDQHSLRKLLNFASGHQEKIGVSK